MATVKGAYGSLVRGVSEQVIHDRLEGQHSEQVNMISDPIRGLVRRHGSQFKDSVPYEGVGDAVLNGFREFSFTAFGDEFSVLYQTRASTLDQPLLAFNTDTYKFVDGVYWTPEAKSRALDGLTSVTALGRYILAAVDRVPSYTTRDEVNQSAGDGAVWIRGGSYSRTYTVTQGNRTASYTTPKSYYEGTLDTSDIPYDDEEYQKKVNDRVNAYNTAVNQYIAEAQQAIQPENIAEQLKNAMLAAGFSCYRVNSHIHVFGLTGADSLTGNDGGDGTFMRVAHREVSSLDDLTRLHLPGTTIKIAVSSEDSYYVQAQAKSTNVSEFQEVSWEEAPGESVSADFPFLIGTFWNDSLYIAHSPQALNDLLPSGHGLTVPREVTRTSGDNESNPLPAFLNRRITHLTVIQDRLVVCSGANVFLSVPGDYFNWYRKSALRVDPDDPIEVYALGAENDTIRGSASLDRSTVFIGDRHHYVLPSRDVLSPASTSIAVQATEQGTSRAQPETVGNLLFFSQRQGGLTKLHQMQVGDFSDSFASFSVSQQITRYLRGSPRQILGSTQPSMVVMVTEGYTNGIYVFHYLDAPGNNERLFDSWSRWEWNPVLGRVMAVASSLNGIVVYTLREINGSFRVVADEFSLDSSPSSLPYMDSMAPLGSDWVEPSGDKFAVISGDHRRRLYGVPLDEVSTLTSLGDVGPSDIYRGVLFDSFYELTPPFLRDEQDNPILAGRTVLTSLGLAVVESAGLIVSIQNKGEDSFNKLLEDSGSQLTGPSSLVGTVPLTDRRVSVYVGKEVREHRLRVAARTWTPLNIATVEWTVQSFNRRS